MVSIVVQARIAGTVRALQELSGEKEILIVDSGSEDRMTERAFKLGVRACHASAVGDDRLEPPLPRPPAIFFGSLTQTLVQKPGVGSNWESVGILFGSRRATGQPRFQKAFAGPHRHLDCHQPLRKICIIW